MLKKTVISFSLLLASALWVNPLWAYSASPSHSLLDVEGIWLTQKGNAHVEVRDCGDGTPCGTMVWVSPSKADIMDMDIMAVMPIEHETRDHDTDDSHAHAAHMHPLIGTQLIWGFKRKDNKWKKGRILNPKTGKTYRSSLQVKNDDTLELKGCAGPVCKSQTWTRIS